MQRGSSFDRVRATMVVRPASVPQRWPKKWRSRYWILSSMPDFAKALRHMERGLTVSGPPPATTDWESQLARYVVAGGGPLTVNPRSVLPPGEIHSTALGSHYFVH